MRPRCTHLQPFAPDVRILHFSVQMYAIFNFCGAYIWTANFAARMRTSGTQGSSLRSRCTHLSLVQLRTSGPQTSPRGCVYLERKVEVCGPDARNFHLAYQMYVSSTFSFHMYAYNSFVSPRPHTHNRPPSLVHGAGAPASPRADPLPGVLRGCRGQVLHVAPPPLGPPQPFSELSTETLSTTSRFEHHTPTPLLRQPAPLPPPVVSSLGSFGGAEG